MQILYFISNGLLMINKINKSDKNDRYNKKNISTNTMKGGNEKKQQLQTNKENRQMNEASTGI